MRLESYDIVTIGLYDVCVVYALCHHLSHVIRNPVIGPTRLGFNWPIQRQQMLFITETS